MTPILFRNVRRASSLSRALALCALSAGACLAHAGASDARGGPASPPPSKSAPKSAPKPTSAAQTKPAAKADAPAQGGDPLSAAAMAALAGYREAVAGIAAFSYIAESSVSGGTSKDDPDAGAGLISASVHAMKAESGGWKLYAKGDVRVGDEITSNFEVATDSVTARSVRVKDRVVAERTIESLEDTRVFFTGQSARHPVAWELLEAIDEGGVARALHEGDSDVEGHACEAVRVELRPRRELVANPGAPGDAQATGARAKDAQTKDAQAKDAQAKSVQVVRLHLSKADHLPRRIDRFLVVTGAKDEAPKPQPVRTLTLKDLRVGEESVGATYSLDVPDGYRVRAADTRKSLGAKGGARAGKNAPKEKDQPRELAGNDAQITWPTDPELLPPGKIAPRFRLPDDAGKRWSNKDFAGKVVVMDFWATWCQPCRIAMPALQRLHERYAGKPVVILGCNIEDDHDLAKKFKAKEGYTYPMLLDASSILDSFKVGSYPTFYVVSPTGKIVWGASGLANPPGLDGRLQPEVYAKYLEDTVAALIDAELAKLDKQGGDKQGEGK
jgi:thiol-disulfide isomerase/thioredoxin